MDLAGYVVNAVLVEGRSVPEVAAAHGVSKTWLYELLARYRDQGDEGLRPQSKRPRRSPTRVPAGLEEQIVALRKSLADRGLDAGAHTIHHHLAAQRPRAEPSVATIWRVLSRRGFVTAQPHKRPRSSWQRFCAELPNECWQADTTHWALADGTDVEILNVVDDHSRLLVASAAFTMTKAADVVATFHHGAARYGFPASMLTDNGAIFTAESRHGRCVMESELARLGVAYKHSRPYHPQTCGKVERFHQTLKRYLAKQPAAFTLAQLQAQLHARTQTASVVVAVGPAEVTVVVRDEGVGFDSQSAYPGHVGLVSMRERTARMGGRLEFATSPGSGTTVSVTIPVDRAATSGDAL